MTTITVTKRDGRKEPLNLEKFHKVVIWATEGITGVSASEVELKSHLQFYNGISTADIQETLIKAAADLISEETPNYQFVAGRLICYHLRKEVYGQFDPVHIKEVVKANIKRGFYDPALIDFYDDAEWDFIDSFIKHDRDETLTYVAMEQMRGKYLVKNRVTNMIYETPQITYALIAATLFAKYPENVRMRWVKDYYDAISTHEISLPTPVMAGVRTEQKQFSSCVLIETDDSLDSINSSTSSIVKYVSQRAGIGIGAGRIRALGSPIRGGQAFHTGVTPFLKHFQSAVGSCSQGGVRKGSATVYYPIFHYEVEDLLVLKNNKGTDDNRVRQMDYGVQFNKLMYERLIEGSHITLFSPSDIPCVMDAFYEGDYEEFKELYERAERNNHIRRKRIKAIDLFSQFTNERKGTGRIYLMNIDHANTHSSFDSEQASIRMSNLCCEINLPTKPLKDVHDEEGEIALCTLSAINWGAFKSPEDMEKACTLAVRGLDALLSYQNYPIMAAKLATENRRPLGIGIINLAYWLAKHDTNYSDPDLELIDTWAQHWSYYLIKASADIAEERAPCPKSNETKYHKGILPVDTYKKEVNELVKHKDKVDWKGLRKQLKQFGIRNSTLMALMPSETSSQIANATNGVEPPRSYVTIKGSKDGVLTQVVPEYRRLKNKYELLWDQESPVGYLKIMAVLQKYIDQGISVNTSYNPQFFEDEKIPMSVMLEHILMFYKYGGKQLYYFNTFDGQGEIDVKEEEDCESCKI